MTSELASVWIVANTSWYVYNFRTSLIRALRLANYPVTVLAPRDEYVDRLIALGVRYINLDMDNGGTNPIRDCGMLRRLYQLFRKERPALLLTFTPKVNIYCALAAGWLGIPVVANISGLGTGFIRGGWLMRLVKRLYRLALRRPRKVFFQNDEDRDLFIREGLVRCELTEVLPGSGVDVERFRPGPRRPPSERFVFLLVARLLRDKGVFEYVEAARQLRMELPCAEFRLMGFLDARNPTAVRREEVLSWEDEGVIRYLGTSDDVRSQYADADCVVLPSYREGTPRTLLEAASMGLPVIAADAVGCRQAVQDGVTGYLCRVRDSADLAEKMRRIVSLTADERIQMGLAGRNKILREFDERIVTARYLDEIKEVMTRLNSGNYCPRASEDAALPRT